MAEWWFHHCGPDRSSETGIRIGLSNAGLTCQSLDFHQPGPHGVLCFSEITDALIETLIHLRGSSQVIMLATRETDMEPRLTWRLLHTGADEVLLWDQTTTASQIQARLERWFVVQSLVDRARSQDGLIGDSSAWRALMRKVVEAGRFTNTPVLLTGESGTGKELLARLIHTVRVEGAQRPDTRQVDARKELVTVDCSTIVPELSGSELFGHERGAFTGAHVQRQGAFALSDGGTLFLDEIGELPLTLQAQLLRAIQEKTYKRVGGNTWYPTSFRLICATNRNLIEQVQAGQFRLDLYHRIAGWVFRTLPLRDRREDIIPLADYFLRQILDAVGPVRLDSTVRDYFVNREYHGNIRELRQLAQRIAHRHVGSGAISAGDIPEDDRPMPGSAYRAWPDERLDRSIADAVASGTSLKQITQTTSETAIRVAVQRERGNLQRAAKRLGVTDRTLQMRKASGRF